jgi:hypothetical protein
MMTARIFPILDRRVRAVVVGAFVSLATLAAAPAQASPDYPAELRKAAALSCVPQCIVCHTTNPGESGTALQPFSLAMRQKGLLPGSPATLSVAYEALKADPNPDYVAMIERLESGYNPNYDPALGQLLCGPTYGCGAHIAKAPPKPFDAFAWALGAVALLVTARTFRPKGQA